MSRTFFNMPPRFIPGCCTAFVAPHLSHAVVHYMGSIQEAEVDLHSISNNTAATAAAMLQTHGYCSCNSTSQNAAHLGSQLFCFLACFLFSSLRCTLLSGHAHRAAA